MAAEYPLVIPSTSSGQRLSPDAVYRDEESRRIMAKLIVEIEILPLRLRSGLKTIFVQNDKDG